MKKILFLHTGGTIAMGIDFESGGVAPVKENPLHTYEPVKELANITHEDFLNLPSPHITPKIMVSLANHIKKKVSEDQFQGVVITHGTDTIEETAYLLDLLLDCHTPVILTGAMRSSNEIGADGLYNLISATKVAISDDAKGKGVMVVFNDEIHSARNVTKTHTSNVATFQSPQYGPIGIVTHRGVFFHHNPIYKEHYDINKLTKRVLLLKAYAGMDKELIAGLTKQKIDGLIIEAFGQGNLPPDMVGELVNLIKRNVPIVLVSRCFNGIVQDVYSYYGGGKQLKEIGVIFTNGLSGQKARLKLMVTLETTSDIQKLQELFYK